MLKIFLEMLKDKKFKEQAQQFSITFLVIWTFLMLVDKKHFTGELFFLAAFLIAIVNFVVWLYRKSKQPENLGNTHHHPTPDDAAQ
ncbi:MAG: hypothetical protein COA52_06090 [Hyphomicrobiales bacterium]|nr:MAG: hypothetical protein COA52_06090 [Hyphomicrobiales bacterium]